MPMFGLIARDARGKRGVRYLNLLVILVVLLIVYPLFEERSFGRALLAVFLTLVVAGAGYAAAETRKEKIVAGAVGVPMVLFVWLGMVYRPTTLLVVAYVLVTIFLFVVIVLLLRGILRHEVVRADTIYGAICVYLLLGIAWAGVYDVIEVFRPGSFQVSEALQVDGGLDWSDTTYFSFVTLTTLGYGDISPVSRLAKSMAMLEAVTGVLYLATLIARLVSMYRAPGEKEG